MRHRIFEPLGLPNEQEAAAAMYRLALADMAANVRRMSVDKGHDPREFSPFSYGGAGGLFLAPVCALASVPEMVAPSNCAVFSALGALMSDYRRSAIRSCAWRVGGDESVVAQIVAALEERVLREVGQAGFAAAAIRLERTAAMRFVGQASEIAVPLPPGSVDEGFSAALDANFRAEYAREFGAGAIWPDTPVEMLNIRVTGVVLSSTGAVGGAPAANDAGLPKPRAVRKVFWPFRMAFASWPVYDRASVPAGQKLIGPAILESDDTTIVVPPGCVAHADGQKNLFIDITGHDDVDAAS
ncbi:MAG: hypothetical protein JOY99_05365 [Sphingomonadaceae bacterium]|nr:hypothetical protein [Sphingomonadaceae bacterium]